MSFPRYPRYKDSGVEWLGQVPDHWTVIRLKQAASVFPSNIDKKSYEGEKPVRLCNYTDVYYGERITADLSFMNATASDDQVERFSLRAGDVIITKDSETANDIARSAYVPETLLDVVCGYHLSIIRAGTVLGFFIKWLFDSSFMRAQVEVRANGLTRVGLSQYAIDSLPIPLPPDEELSIIAEFLDQETAKIDALVEEQRRLIELLKEKRQAVISHAVTKGLNPNAPMKDSGVEWIGLIPEHWRAERTRRLFQERDDRSASGDEEMLTVSHLTGVTKRAEKTVYMFEAETNEGYKICCKGDLVINTLWGWMGAMGTAPQDGMVSPAYNVYAPTEAIDSLYVDSLVRTRRFIDEITRYSKGVWSSRLRIYPAEFFQLCMPVPPISEQHHIAASIKRLADATDALVREGEAAIDLLQERRSALISAAVTGKIDVRNYARDDAVTTQETYAPA